MFKYILSLLIAISFGSTGHAQNERKLGREGNKEYKNDRFPEAELKYRKSLEKNQSFDIAKYNLGNALYKQGKYNEALQQFSESQSMIKDKKALSNRYYNMGNSLLKENKYTESIEAYKKALRNNPEDEDARYNLSYAMSKMTQQQKQQQENKNQNKDQQENKQQQQNKDNQEKQENKQQKQQQQQNQHKISKEDAERILQALKNEEKELQEKMKRKEGKNYRPDKDW